VTGYFGIGIVNGKTGTNLGTLWRSAYQLGADFIFTVGRRHPKQSSDTTKTPRHVPLWEFQGREEFKVPQDCVLVGIEMGGTPIHEFKHPKRACYVLGAEDHGLPNWIQERCVHTVEIESIRRASFNVAVAGAIVMHDRITKETE